MSLLFLAIVQAVDGIINPYHCLCDFRQFQSDPPIPTPQIENHILPLDLTANEFRLSPKISLYPRRGNIINPL